jgi:outer membrane protein assembly factor BamB
MGSNPNGCSYRNVKNKAGAVAIDKTGNIYVGTRTTIYGFKTDGTQLWKVAGKVTEIGSFALDGETLYAAQIGGAGLLALNTADGSTKWNVEAAGDIYAPIVDKSGNIYFTDKGGKALYSVDKAGQLKWKFTIDAAPTYCFPVLDDKGTVYFGSGAGRIYAVDSANGEELWHMDSEGTDNNAKIMSGMTIGENQMLQFLCPAMVDVNTKASGRSLYDVTHIVELPDACSTILNGSRLDGINYMIQRQTVERQHRVVLFSHFSRLVQRSNIAFKEIRSAVVCHLLYLL